MLLLTSQRNELFDILEQNILNPNDFEICEKESIKFPPDEATWIVPKKSNFFFIFETGNQNPQGRHFAIFSPGYTEPIEEHFSGSWTIQISYFSQ